MNHMRGDWQKEVSEGERFTFGDNWASFLRLLNEQRIKAAEKSLQAMLDSERFDGKRFLDAGSGSGLFSLAARRLGAEVVSFDFDPQSVACTRALKQRFFPDDATWTIEQGSVLDSTFLDTLGTFDVVYSWGVLHHTGAMWDALANVVPRVAAKGQLFIAIYNDQGRSSRIWKRVKKAYVSAPRGTKWAILLPALVRLRGPSLVRDTLAGHPLRSWRNYSEQSRGMDSWRNVLDWVGGYPFEVAKPEAIFEFFRERGFELQQLKTCAGGHGCNEFVFRRLGPAKRRSPA